MALLAYNRTGAPLSLAAGHPIVVLEASSVPPAFGSPSNVTSKLTPDLSADPAHGKLGGVTVAEFAQLQAQVIAGLVVFEWTSLPEYLTPGLFCIAPIPLQRFSTATRPDPTALPAGVMIFNTDDGAPNWSNGAVWVDALGNET